jgi:hypothetical protein
MPEPELSRAELCGAEGSQRTERERGAVHGTCRRMGKLNGVWRSEPGS